MVITLQIRVFLILLVAFCVDGISQVPVPAPEIRKPLERELKGGETHEFVFSLPADHYVNVVALQQGINVVLTLIGPDGERRLAIDSSNGKTGTEPLWFVTDVAGDFILRVSSLDGSAPAGRYGVQWNESITATSDLRNFAKASNLVLEGVNLGTARKPDSDARALEKFNTASELYEQIRDHKQAKAGGFARMGRVYRSARKPDLSLKYFDKAIDLFLEINQKRDAMLNLVEAQGLASSQIEFIERNERVKALAIEIGDRGYQVGALIQIATGYYELGDYSTALQTIRSALPIATDLKDDRRLEAIYNNMGSIYEAQGNLSSAFEAHDRAIGIQLSRNGGKLTGDTLLNVGNVYVGLRKFESALEYYRKALAIFEQGKANVGIAYAISNIGSVYLEMGDYDKALEYFLRSQPLKAKFLPKDPKTAYNIGSVYKLKGNLERALENFQTALELCRSNGDTRHEADSLVMISDVHNIQGDFHRALRFAKEAEFVAMRHDFDKPHWGALLSASSANLALGNVAEARSQLESAVSIIERGRATFANTDSGGENYFEDRTDPYTSLIGILVNENKDLSALEMAERIKARSLLDSLAGHRGDTEKIMSVESRQAERRLKNDLASINGELSKENDQKARDAIRDRLDRKRLEFEDFRTRLYASHPELRIQRGEMKPIDVEQMGTLITEGKSAILEFVIAESKSFVFVVTKGRGGNVGIKVYPIPLQQKVLLSRIESLRTKLATGDLDFQPASRDLYELLLKPAEKELAGKTKIIIVPDGPLWDLPFQALVDENGKYLVEKVAVSYAPSLTALREMTKKAKTRKPDSGLEFLAFGNPIVGKETSDRVKRVFMSEKLEPLPESERLVNELGKMYGAGRSKIYVGSQAREETAKTESPKYRIVQFATHGILNNASPMYSHLVLAQNDNNPNEDGLLEAWEMKDLDLKADMVILSACETARGRIAGGEGVIGMSWAMFIAGTPTTVASQWKVESSSTTELMLEFHRQMLAGKGVSKAEALRRASLKLMKVAKYKHPSYWAGFVIVGDGS